MTDPISDVKAEADPALKKVEFDASQLIALGIVTHQHTAYEWNGYRYTNASDAVAAATRAKR